MIDAAVAARQSVVLLTPHFCNWEWLLPAGGARFGLPIDAVYQRQRVASLDRFLREARSRFGGKPIPREDFVYELMSRAGTPRGYALIADQTPPRDDKKHWSRFLNRDTAFFVGAEKVARFLDSPVLYVAMRRVGRGRYSVRLVPLAMPPFEHEGSGGGHADHGALRAAARSRDPGEPRRLALAAEAVEIPEARAVRRRQKPRGRPARLGQGAGAPCVFGAGTPLPAAVAMLESLADQGASPGAAGVPGVVSTGHGVPFGGDRRARPRISFKSDPFSANIAVDK